ncbi:MAG: sigma-54-dependent Fis family transcriptional regulator [Rubrivivax sp.]|nr:sigma-54-dependent Fis family transcriptional regulator [Pyrinomonadaceae bacterium]
MIEIVARSEAMREALRLAGRVAATDANVLVTGESGAGKDALALFIHAMSPRAMGPFVKIDCASLPGELLEAELFGYERGAFTGATAAKPGRLEAAHKGTLVLDEIAHLPWDAQAKLLRVIELREFERLGGRRTVRVDARLVALTNVDLDDAVRRRAFREDLFYRLNVVRIHVPPLRERGEDVEPLAVKFLEGYAAKHGRAPRHFATDALAALAAYDFPGNVRELANIIERAVIVTEEATVGAKDLPEAVRTVLGVSVRRTHRPTLAELEAEYVREILEAARGNKSEAARILGISRKNLYEKLAKQKQVAGGQWSVVGKKAEARGQQLGDDSAETGKRSKN